MTDTPKLGLARPADDAVGWGGAYRDAMDILDDNPGIVSVADDTEMAALDTWGGRICWREDEDIHYKYDGSAWQVFDVEALVNIDNFEYLGDYEELLTYFELNMVYCEVGEEGAVYICIDDNDGAGISDIPPTNETHWALFVPSQVGPPGEPGEDGEDGVPGEQGPQGEPGTVEGAGGPKRSTAQEVTASVAAEGSVSGAIAFDCSFHTGAEIMLLMVNVDPTASVDGFKFQLFSEEAETTLLYELDTSQDEEYIPGDAVRDPNGGFKTVCYYIDSDADAEAIEGSLWYRVENLDTETASTFTIDVDYKALV